ncbi:MAG: ATP-dependent DNA ligase [Coprothermobacterota bacterium]|nr:ATP-dependent DNA ligase [Coprothermobacterota bacterium]
MNETGEGRQISSDPSFEELAGLLAALERTPQTSRKVVLVAEFLRELPAESLLLAARALSGLLLPLGSSQKLKVGWRLIVDSLRALPIRQEGWIEAYRETGDMGSTVAAMLEEARYVPEPPPLSLVEVHQRLAEVIAAGGKDSRSGKRILLEKLWRRLSSIEIKFLIRLFSGDLRVGLKEGLVEAGVAGAFEVPLAQVRHANLLRSDIGEVALMAQAGTLAEASLELLHPCRLMLAELVVSAAVPFALGPHRFLAEDKYDGIRAQVHRQGEEVRVFSRNLEEIGLQFPEILAAARALPGEWILDGEIVAFGGEIQPFFLLQQRLHRVNPEAMLIEAPVAYFAFDLLFQDGESLLHLPLEERRQRLEALPLHHPFLLGRQVPVSTEEETEAAFRSARERGTEGLVLKEPASPYQPGHRGKQWLKLKKELTTLDCLVVAVEWGNGKRAGLLSDYTFAVHGEDGGLLTIGKAYNGLTDRELKEMTAWFLAHKTRDLGWQLEVEPKIVVEVAFNSIQESARHSSGYALRFPRIKGIRWEKSPEEIDSLEVVRRIYVEEVKSR